jgi:hypothetical protein
MMKGYSEKREYVRTKKKGHHGVAFEQHGRNLIEDRSTSDSTGVDSLDREQSQDVNVIGLH